MYSSISSSRSSMLSGWYDSPSASLFVKIFCFRSNRRIYLLLLHDI